MIGNSKIHKADPPQLTIVENGKKLASTIYGIYIQTIGPRENPKFIMYRKSPSKIRKTEKLGDYLLIINPKPIRKLVREAPIVPNCSIYLRPYLVSKNELIIAVTTC
jgi:hypothetical protein